MRRKNTVTTGNTSASTNFDPAIEWDGFSTDTVDDLGKYQPGDVVIPPTSACGDTTTLISAIQGNGEVSPVIGQTVNIEAIVVASFQEANQLGGFFLQESNVRSDLNPATSEGIYVASSQIVNVGDRVHVSGAVAEKFKLTQITPTKISVCASNETLPTIVTLSLPVKSLNDFESVEGMRVSVSQTLTVNENYTLGRFGEVLLANGRLQTPTNSVSPGAAAIALQESNNLNKLILDDLNTKQNPDPVIFPAPGLSAINTLRSGDTVSNLSGIISYDFSKYRLLPTTTPNFEHSNPRPVAPAEVIGANLKVASFNVLNFFNGDGVG
ncbi:MAG: DNA degradation protein EddB, partial [Moraxellaceae bacterium]